MEKKHASPRKLTAGTWNNFFQDLNLLFQGLIFSFQPLFFVRCLHVKKHAARNSPFAYHHNGLGASLVPGARKLVCPVSHRLTSLVISVPSSERSSWPRTKGGRSGAANVKRWVVAWLGGWVIGWLGGWMDGWMDGWYDSMMIWFFFHKCHCATKSCHHVDTNKWCSLHHWINQQLNYRKCLVTLGWLFWLFQILWSWCMLGWSIMQS